MVLGLPIHIQMIIYVDQYIIYSNNSQLIYTWYGIDRTLHIDYIALAIVPSLQILGEGEDKGSLGEKPFWRGSEGLRVRRIVAVSLHGIGAAVRGAWGRPRGLGVGGAFAPPWATAAVGPVGGTGEGGESSGGDRKREEKEKEDWNIKPQHAEQSPS